MAVYYEWDVELAAAEESDDYEEGEIVDHDFCESFSKAKAAAQLQPPPGMRFQVVLVRNDDAGRSWAYVEDGKLQEHFTDANGCIATKVPKRFIHQLI